MQHCDPDGLALVALGEQPSPEDAAHLDACPDCRADVADLRQVVSAVRVEVPAGPAVAPPPRVWEAIAAQTGVRVAPRPERVLEASGPADPDVPGHEDAAGRRDVPVAGTPPVPSSPGPGDPGPAGPSSPPFGRGASRRHRSAPPRSGGWRTLAVAASALLVGAVGGVGLTSALRDDPAQPAAPSVLAQTPLQGLPLAPDASGRAQIVQAGDARRLAVDVARLAPERQGTFYEVWLIDRDVRNMVPVGILRGARGEFVIPDGLDVGEYPVVDISVETPGDPRHSGRSVLRGTIAG